MAQRTAGINSPADLVALLGRRIAALDALPELTSSEYATLASLARAYLAALKAAQAPEDHETPEDLEREIERLKGIERDVTSLSSGD